MNKSILILLISLLSLSIYDIFVKDRLDFSTPAAMKDSKSCVNLNEKETFSCLTAVHNAGNATGNDLFILGQMYLQGIGTEQDTDSAIKLLELNAIEHNTTDAMVLLGDLVINNDPLSATYWYSRAANNNDPSAQLKLAQIYRYGEESMQNPALAFELYKAATNAGSLTAQYELALMYAMGIGTTPNLDRSLFMLEKPCDQGHQESCALLNKIQELRMQ